MSEAPVVVPTGLSLPVLQAPQPVAESFPSSAAVSVLPASDTVPDKVVEPPHTTPITMSAYNDKSVVVRGNTKKYAGNFQAAGGKWNPHLMGGGGWIFPLTASKEVQGLIDGIAAGAILPIAKERRPKFQQPQVVYPQPYGMAPQPYMMQPQPYMSSPQIPQVVYQPQPQYHKHGFQTVTYNVYKPQLGMTAKVHGEGANFEAKVISVTPNPDGTVTTATIQVLARPETFEVGLWNGHWALRGVAGTHNIRFEH